jgi:hypothetical protein
MTAVAMCLLRIATTLPTDVLAVVVLLVWERV